MIDQLKEDNDFYSDQLKEDNYFDKDQLVWNIFIDNIKSKKAIYNS